MEGSMERISKRRDTGVKKRKAEERKAVKIGRILQSYGHTQRDETKERRDGWNCI